MLSPQGDSPTFLGESTGGHFKNKNPTIDMSTLTSNWVADAQTIYIGKAGDLHRRLKQFLDFGTGKPIGHWGGRLVWQLDGTANYQIAWKKASSPEAYESELIDEFAGFYGTLPFANLKRGRNSVAA